MHMLDPAASALTVPKTTARKSPPRPFIITHDIDGAFNNVRPKILTEIMERRKMPTYLTKWVAAFCSQRTMAFCFSNQSEPQRPFRCGLPQGSPLSPALFLVYANLILERVGASASATTETSYIDDLSVARLAPNTISATRFLQERTNQILERGTHLHLQLSPGKSELLHLIPTQSSATPASATTNTRHMVYLPIPGKQPVPINPSPSARCLGVIVDERLSFKPHAMAAASAGRQALGRLGYLRSNRWRGSVGFRVCRHLVLSMVLPKMLWASPVWWTGPAAVLDPLEVTYNMSARWITGLPPTTAIPKLLAAAHLPPLGLYLDYLSTRYAIRLHFLPVGHPLRLLITPPPVTGRERPNRIYPSINRVLSFTDGFVEGTLEDCSTENHGMVLGIISGKDLVHREKSARAKKHQERWIRSLPDLTMIIYTDGSRQLSGDVGCGWAI